MGATASEQPEEAVQPEPGRRFTPAAPNYIDALLPDFASGAIGRFNHLGHWDGDEPASLRAAQQRMNDIVVDLAGVRDGARVLDVGCGFGGTLAAVDANFDRVRLVGVDVDRRQLAICGRIDPRGDSLAWSAADGCELPFADASFDHVLSIEVMWHLGSRRRFLEEVSRVVCDGGGVAVVDLLLEPGAAAAVGLDDDQLAATLRRGFHPWPAPFASMDDVLAWADGSGLECSAVVDATEATKRTYADHLDSNARPGAAGFSDNEAVRVFVELHRQDLLRVVYLGWRRRERRARRRSWVSGESVGDDHDESAQQ